MCSKSQGFYAPPDPRPPLWEAMVEAVINAPPPTRSPAGTIAAAEIRAVRDWLKVELPEGGAWYVLLTAEADRAERADG